MNKQFLDKVVNQILSETKIDYREETINLPYCQTSPYPYRNIPFTIYLLQYPTFKKHCRDIYSLKNFEEMGYVWDEFRENVGKYLVKHQMSNIKDM